MEASTGRKSRRRRHRPPSENRVRVATAAHPAHTAAASELAERPAAQQKALFEKVRAAAGAQKEAVQDIAQVTSSIGLALSQALHTDDAARLDEIFQETPVPSIAATVRRLDAAESLDLLNRCTHIFQAQPQRVQQVLPWIKEVVKTHAVFLMTQPEVAELLAPVQHAIREHLATMPKLLLLEGRLELLLSRLPGYQNVTVNPKAIASLSEQVVLRRPAAPAERARAAVVLDSDEDDDAADLALLENGVQAELGEDEEDEEEEEAGEEEAEQHGDMALDGEESEDGSLHDSQADSEAEGAEEEEGEEDEEDEDSEPPMDLRTEGL